MIYLQATDSKLSKSNTKGKGCAAGLVFNLTEILQQKTGNGARYVSFDIHRRFCFRCAWNYWQFVADVLKRMHVISNRAMPFGVVSF
jgi:hypothetical protein